MTTNNNIFNIIQEGIELSKKVLFSRDTEYNRNKRSELDDYLKAVRPATTIDLEDDNDPNEPTWDEKFPDWDETLDYAEEMSDFTRRLINPRIHEMYTPNYSLRTCEVDPAYFNFENGHNIWEEGDCYFCRVKSCALRTEKTGDDVYFYTEEEIDTQIAEELAEVEAMIERLHDL